LSGISQAVFISYASEDAAAAGRIGEALRAAGIEVWFDKSEVRGGEATPAFVARIAALLDPRPATGANTGSVNPAAALAISLRSGMGAGIAKRRGPALMWVAALAVALSCFAAYALWPKMRTRTEQPAAVVRPAAAPDAPAIPEKSVAVLPFVDMSEKKDQEYFSDAPRSPLSTASRPTWTAGRMSSSTLKSAQCCEK
jgi:hypothetical protein